MTYFIGLMSGTSLDGIDTAICSIDKANNFSLLDAQTFPIPDFLKKELLTLSQEHTLRELDRYARLDVQMGRLYAECCLQILEKNNLKTEQIQAIGSHGQTLRHYPTGQYPTTLQIGDPNIIAHNTRITTIADFRRRDMAAGGQGAPLVPPFHHALFNKKSVNRVILNIGGIANITFLPAYPEDNSQDLILGYDTGPGNGLMDDWCVRHFNCAYDPSGELAAQGSINQALLSSMLSDPYFSQNKPKSTGREYFSYQWIEFQLKKQATQIDTKDVLATLLELTSLTISHEIQSLKPHANEVLVCGGGVRNKQLMQHLQMHIPDITVASTENFGLHPDWVEACAFAWFAHQTLNGLSSNLPSVTGAQSEVILGAIWQA